MKSCSKVPKKFSWRLVTEPKATADSVCTQEQCGCGPGGGDQCCGQCGGR